MGKVGRPCLGRGSARLFRVKHFHLTLEAVDADFATRSGWRSHPREGVRHGRCIPSGVGASADVATACGNLKRVAIRVATGCQNTCEGSRGRAEHRNTGPALPGRG
jgi:hypothetical protein